MERDQRLASVETLYEGRRTGDLGAFAQVLAPDAVFRFAGEGSIIAEFPGGSNERPEEVAQALFDELDMLERRLISAVCDGPFLAVRFATVLRPKGGEPFEQELFDLWEFDDQGKIVSGTQFQDTAKIINEIRKVRQPAS